MRIESIVSELPLTGTSIMGGAVIISEHNVIGRAQQRAACERAPNPAAVSQAHIERYLRHRCLPHLRPRDAGVARGGGHFEYSGTDREERVARK